MGIFDKLFGKKKETTQKERKEGDIKVSENKDAGFLASLNTKEKLAVSNLSPNIYLAAIMQKDNANAAERIIDVYSMQDPKLANSIKLLERLPISELQRLGLSVHVAQKGVKAYSEGNLTEAKGHLEEACQHNPYNADAWSSLGVVIAKAGDHKEGVKIIKKALSLDPDNQSARDNLSAIIGQK